MKILRFIRTQLGLMLDEANPAGLVLFVMLAAFTVLALATAAHGQDALCQHDREGMTGGLSSKYEEYRRAVAVVSGGVLMEVFVSEKGTWTILVTGLNGCTTPYLAGDQWLDVPAPVTIEGDPT